ncbi:Oxidoreductase ptaL [Lachnellula suecica]|uniref:Oxidoreductase ptaL n=1 Tax=Lachnellula suecica TaxID=602035 RepID=A0A8T9BWD0_9HELO|nr:Oxidoreductase ptaL [Lachnellula suecica]
MATTQNTHEILILGGHHAGVNTAHYLLRHIIPTLSKQTPSTSYHVTMVCPNKEYYWNIAAPRHLVDDTQIPLAKIFLSIVNAFRPYKKEQFSKTVGKAVGLDEERKEVKIQIGPNETRNIKYSSLVVATGASYKSALWQVNDSDDATKNEFTAMRKALATAKTAFIAGGGPLGVETAGEISSKHPSITTTLLSGSKNLLTRLSASTSATAEWRLNNLGVKTLHDVRVASQSKNADGSTSLTLTDNSTRNVDVYIDATGGRPNTSFCPTSWLSPSGHVLTDSQTLRSTVQNGIYAIGDAASYSNGSIIAANGGVAPVATSIGIDIAKQEGIEGLFKQKVYKEMKDTQFVPIGPNGGVGQVAGWGVPSLMVWAIKGRSFFVGMAEGAVNGGSFKKA